MNEVTQNSYSNHCGRMWMQSLRYRLDHSFVDQQIETNVEYNPTPPSFFFSPFLLLFS